MSPEDYYRRQIELWGETVQRTLASRRIAIIGCGGLGSSLALALGGSGIGTIDVVDFDTVAPHNLHRQIAFEVADEGLPKAEVVARRMRARNPFVRAESFAVDFDTFAKRASGYDLLLDATDNLSVRRSMDAWAHREGIPWVYGSVEAFHAQVCLFEQADFGAFGSAEHTPAGIAAPMVMQAASLQANLALRYLAGLPVKKDTLYYLTFDSEGAPSIRTFALSV